MEKQIKGLLYFLAMEVRYSLMIFWSILLSILVVGLTISYFLLGVEDGRLYFALSFCLYIYGAIYGFQTVKESIPFALKMGATRKNIYISIGFFFLLLAFAKAFFVNTIQSVTLYLIDITNLHTFRMLHPAFFLTDNWLNRFIIDMSIIFFCLSFMFIIGLLFYRYGLLGGGIFIGILAIALLLGIAQGWLIEFFAELFSEIAITFFLQLLGIGIIIYLTSFLFIKRITTINVR